MKKFKRILVANRGEIAIRIFRACKELGIRTVAIYSEEDKKSLFRTIADEAYQVGKNKKPIDAYLGIDEIIKVALHKGVDAIHPGYGFLSENAEFARKVEEAGITFIGPTHEMMDSLGDKVKSKTVAQSVNVPTIPGVEGIIESEEKALEAAEFLGYPVMLKASAGGGGRGMRIVRSEDKLVQEYRNAKNEAKKAFGIDDMFIEKFLERPKHIEVQILGDNHGKAVHLFERDCSIQRRHQKVIEFTPALSITDEQRQAICSDALKIAQAVSYRNAGTVEFLVDSDGNHYFIEMNPRIQVEHTITEMTTGIDLVQSQILVAQGATLEEIGIPSQEAIVPRGYSIQTRLTTEDPNNHFAPDTGHIDYYRTSSGCGIRLDGGNGFTGADISPYYDSLLFKLISWSPTFEGAINKSKRALAECQIRGVKTNLPFLLNVLNHPEFVAGTCDTGFIGDHPELMDIVHTTDRIHRTLDYIGKKVVNSTTGEKPDFNVPIIPSITPTPGLSGTKQILDAKGPEGLSRWILDQKKLLLTDTTFRDAHQSLMATRVRTVDMAKIAPVVSEMAKDLFSLEMWGGATFDVAYRFLNESPWDRLRQIRQEVPNILLQMLIRGSNAVGYKNYPDNVIREFIGEASRNGIDVFRIFDALNWTENMKVSIDEVRKQNKVAEAAICYTGDILDPKKTKYTLDYYVKMARELEGAGANILAIKDMSSLLKPNAAYELVKALKEEVKIPIHLHTHDTSGNGVATLMMANMAGVDIVDTAFNSMSGLTSQPALNSVVAAVANTDRDTQMNLDDLQKIANYWEDVRPVYKSFESGLRSGTTEIYKYEIPGGQYSNLKPQVESFGLGDRFEDVKEMFRRVNDMFGDIVKVTPTSKVVGDMAIFMIQNNLTPENIYEEGEGLDYPDSVVTYFEGMMGQPHGGFPERLQKLVLKDKTPITCRPGELMEDEDFDALEAELRKKFDIEPRKEDLLAYALYPKVFEDYLKKLKDEGDFSLMGSDVFYHGLRVGETCEVTLEEGRILVVKLLEVRSADDQRMREVVFEVNGNQRIVKILDEKISALASGAFQATRYADPENNYEIGASIPGNVLSVLVKEGDKVVKNQPVAIVEAMKMETNILAQVSGTVGEVFIEAGDKVEAAQLVMVIED